MTADGGACKRFTPLLERAAKELVTGTEAYVRACLWSSHAFGPPVPATTPRSPGAGEPQPLQRRQSRTLGSLPRCPALRCSG